MSSTRSASAFMLLLVVTTFNRVSSAEPESITWPKDAEVEFHYRRLLTEQSATPTPPPVVKGSNWGSVGIGVNPGGSTVRTCAAVKVQTTGNGNASAFAQCQGLVFAAGAQACAESISQTFGSGCGGDVYASAVAAIQTCTKAAVRVMVQGFSSSTTSGPNTTACAKSCCYSQSSASSFAQAAAEAFSQALSCSTEVQAYLKSDAYSQSWVNASLAAYTYACSRGGGAAYARVDGMAEAFSLSLVKIFADIQALACSSTGCTSCSYCPPAGTVSTVEAIGESVNGARALAKSYSDAAAQLCHDKESSPDVIRAKVYGCLEVAAKTCAAAMVKLSGVAAATPQQTPGDGNVACTWIKGTANALSLARATVDTAQYAFAQTFANGCPAAVQTMATQFISVDAIQDCQVEAVQQMCAANGEVTLATTLASCLKESGSQALTALSDAFGEIIDVNGCNCMGADWCCTTCTADTCDLYK